MSRAIDADALSEWLKDYGQKVIKGERKISLMYVWKHIQDMQTIEERKTGKWIERNPQNSEICRLIECSECGKGYAVGFNVPYEDWTEAHKYCVECGAKMNGADHD